MGRAVIILAMLVLVFSCAPRKVSTTPETQKPVAEESTMQQKHMQKEQMQRVGEQEMEHVQMQQVEEPREVKLTEAEKAEIFKDIYFDFDRYDIKDEYKETLKKIADWMIANPDAKLIIEGHCDERGTNEYNLGLGDRRANAAKQYLISLGVPASRIQTISYGEERPVCTEHNEQCWWRNRRAHFVVVEE